MRRSIIAQSPPAASGGTALCGVTNGLRSAFKLLHHGGKHVVDVEVSHAAVVLERAGPLLAGAAVDRYLQRDFLRVSGVTPGDVRGAEQCDHRDAERRREVPRARV